ncbi:MAG: hydrogenase maturation protease [Acidobacteriota bacterium]
MDLVNAILAEGTVLMGIGCEGRGDDAFGTVLARRALELPGVQALDCGDRPEDFTGEVAALDPSLVLLADAIELEAGPGEIALLTARDLSTSGMDTHRASLGTLMTYLEHRTGVPVLLIGVQAGHAPAARELSPEVADALDLLVDLLRLRGLSTGGGGHGT